MSSSNASSDAIAAIIWSSTMIVRCWGFFLPPLGIVGHTLSIYVFTRPAIRSKSCTRYLLASTIAGSLVACMNVPLRILQFGFDINVLNFTMAGCKIISYFCYLSRVFYSWFMVLASADRCLCSSLSPRVRAWSSLRNANLAIPFTALIICLGYVHVLVYYTIPNQQIGCNAQQGFYQFFYVVWDFVVYGVAPSFCMLFFILLTIRHIRAGKRQVVPLNNQNQAQPQQNQTKTDRQLFQMMFAQCFVFIFTSCIFTVASFYYVMAPSLAHDALEVARGKLIVVIFGLITLSVPCLSFYVYTLSSELFRREIMHLFNRQRPPEIQAVQNTSTMSQKTNGEPRIHTARSTVNPKFSYFANTKL